MYVCATVAISDAAFYVYIILYMNTRHQESFQMFWNYSENVLRVVSKYFNSSRKFTFKLVLNFVLSKVLRSWFKCSYKKICIFSSSSTALRFIMNSFLITLFLSFCLNQTVNMYAAAEVTVARLPESNKNFNNMTVLWLQINRWSVLINELWFSVKSQGF